ncbi:MAG: asparagine synthase-related protein [Promethearchaeota archaeon]
MDNQMRNLYPCIFGFIALDKSSFYFQKPNFVDIIYYNAQTEGIYMTQVTREFHFYQSIDNLAILFGRIYSPFKINANCKDTSNYLKYILNTNFNKIQGDYSLIFKSLSSKNPNINLVTDKFGSRRILYILNNNRLLFSTHILGLKILLNRKLPEISVQALRHYYNFGFTPNDQTLLKNIRKLPPGSILSVNERKLSIKKYFSIKDLYNPEKYRNYDQNSISDKIDEFMFEAIKKRNSNKNSVGIALSGGVDSGYIAQKLRQCGAKPIGYNLSYRSYYNEHNRIEYLEKKLGLIIRKIFVTPDQIIKNYEYCNSISSEPMLFNNACMRFVALEARKDGITELFDGDGADRIFLGMKRYLLLKKLIKFYELSKKGHFYPFINGLLRILPRKELRKAYIHFKNWNYGIHPYPERDMEGLVKYNLSYEQEVYNLAIKKFYEEFRADFNNKDFGLFFTFQSIQMCPEMFFYDSNDIQTELGIFPISAYWDDDLISIAISIPTELKLRKRTTKYILRKAAAKNLDYRYWMKPKIGLQNSFKYVKSTEKGLRWIKIQREKVKSSNEYKILKEIVPDGRVVLDKLIGLIVWKEHNLG